MGKRRTAREMAVQMLYQRDLGGSDLAQIFTTFDVPGYLSEPPDSQGRGGKGRGPRQREAGRPNLARRRGRLEEAFRYAQELVQGTLEHREEIDDLIRRQADNWRLERMPPVDRNILRLAVYEMLYETDVPKLVIVDEAIELAKKFGSENSARFINGLLDGLLRHHSFPGRLT